MAPPQKKNAYTYQWAGKTCHGQSFTIITVSENKHNTAMGGTHAEAKYRFGC